MSALSQDELGLRRSTRRRPRWVCRLLGHRYRDPFLGYVIDFYCPSAEGRPGFTDDLIGTCGCGNEWRTR